MSLPPEKYLTPKAQAAFYDRVIDGLLEVPGVTAAGVVNIPPGVGGTGRRSVLLEGDPVPASAEDLRRANVRVVSPGYFETLGLTPRMGRFFSATDPPTLPVAIVNEAFVRQHLQEQVAVGRRLRLTLGRITALDPSPRTIVGVVADLKEQTLYEPTPPTVYVPLAQADATRMALLVRSARSIGELMPVVRTAVMSVDPDVAAAEFMAVNDLVQGELSLNRLTLALLGVLSTVSLLLAVIGVYGVTAHIVRQRTREIGIRMALGVSPQGVRRLLLGEGGALALVGIACGGVAATWSAGLLRSLVHGIDHTSTSTFVWAGLVLAAAVLAGCYFPARRAARIDPAIVLRSE